MHIYQLVDFVLGVVMLPLGLAALCQDLGRLRNGTFRNCYADWRSLTLSVWFVSGGPAHIARGIEPRGQESHLSGVLQWIAITCLSALLIANGIAWLIRRRQSQGQVIPAPAHPAI